MRYVFGWVFYPIHQLLEKPYERFINFKMSETAFGRLVYPDHRLFHADRLQNGKRWTV